MNIITADALKCLPEMPDKSVDVVLTSPPYNRKRNDKYAEYDDDIEDYYGFLKNTIDELLRVCRKWIFFNIQATYYNRADVYRLIGEYADRIQNIIIWNKKNPMPANANNITNAYEFIIVFGDKPLQSNFTYTMNSISTSVNNDMPDEHKAVMSLELAGWIILMFTQPNDLVLDCFFGTGTTGVACKIHGRDFIGIEINEKYSEYAKKRIEGTLDIATDAHQMTFEDVLAE